MTYIYMNAINRRKHPGMRTVQTGLHPFECKKQSFHTITAYRDLERAIKRNMEIY